MLIRPGPIEKNYRKYYNKYGKIATERSATSLMKNKISKLSAIFIAVSMVAGVMGCSQQESVKNPDLPSEDLGLNGEVKEASQYTIDRNNEVYALLDFDDRDEFENATRGLIAAPETLDIKDEKGKVIWSQTAYSFVESDSPDTANPSLWRNTQLNLYGDKGIYHQYSSCL